MTSIWQADRPLLLASKSQARRSLLAAAGIPFEAIGARIDERAIEAPLRLAGGEGDAIAQLLAREKALDISREFRDRLVLGADQTLSIGDAILTKPADRAAAKVQISTMSGKVHTLHAAVCLAQDGQVISEGMGEAWLTCRVLSPQFIDCYLDLAVDAVLQTVGGYAVEGLGIHLFDKIEGEHSTILGLPMLALLRMLRAIGCVVS